MPIQIKEVKARSILTPQKAGALSDHYDFTINPYAGCAFRCSYCYVPKFPNARHLPQEWGSWLEVKINAPELIREGRLKVFASRIFFSSATDPYQYIELQYRLTRKCLEELLRYQPAQITMHTRSHLMLQDLELLKSFKDRLTVGVSIPTDDESIRNEFEPNAPSIARRLELISTLTENGIKVYAAIAPLLPCDPDRLASLLAVNVESAWVGAMNWIDVNTQPQLLEKYKDFFSEPHYESVRHSIKRKFQGKLLA